jgi:hypothetical protein
MYSLTTYVYDEEIKKKQQRRDYPGSLFGEETPLTAGWRQSVKPVAATSAMTIWYFADTKHVFFV